MFKDYENKAMTQYKTKIRLNAPLRGHNQGETIQIDTDKEGVPIAKYWRDRLKDAQIDDCIELIKEKTNKSDKGSKK